MYTKSMKKHIKKLPKQFINLLLKPTGWEINPHRGKRGRFDANINTTWLWRVGAKHIDEYISHSDDRMTPSDKCI